MDEGEGESISREEAKKQLEEERGRFDHEGFEREHEEQRLAKERSHAGQFVGQAPLGVLIVTILSDYQQWADREQKLLKR